MMSLYLGQCTTSNVVIYTAYISDGDTRYAHKWANISEKMTTWKTEKEMG
jgi:hypothetical protein